MTTNRQLLILDSTIDPLNEIKEIILEYMSNVRSDGSFGKKGLELFKINNIELSRIKNQILELYTSELNSVHYTCVSLLKIISALDKANIYFHEFVEEKVFTGNNKMSAYDSCLDHLTGVFNDLHRTKLSIHQLMNS